MCSRTRPSSARSNAPEFSPAVPRNSGARYAWASLPESALSATNGSGVAMVGNVLQPASGRLDADQARVGRALAASGRVNARPLFAATDAPPSPQPSPAGGRGGKERRSARFLFFEGWARERYATTFFKPEGLECAAK